jgi:hypothetical protein
MIAWLVSPDFERFVSRHFGARGRAWLDELPEHAELQATDSSLTFSGQLAQRGLSLLSYLLVRSQTKGVLS